MKFATGVLGVVVVLGTFAGTLLAWADARATRAEQAAAASAATASAEVGQLRKDTETKLEATREDIRGVYRYLLTKERQPRLERAPSVGPLLTEDPP